MAAKRKRGTTRRRKTTTAAKRATSKKKAASSRAKPAPKKAGAKPTGVKRAGMGKAGMKRAGARKAGAKKPGARKAGAKNAAPKKSVAPKKTTRPTAAARAPAKRVIAVVGATGSQGGGLARAILNDPPSGFTVRAITRNPDSPAARELARLGAQVVRADAQDRASLERAFAGAYGAYCVSFFWAHMSPEREKAEASAMAQAAKRAGIRHAIWSTLEDTRQFVPLGDTHIPTIMGHYKVPHFDAKAEGDAYFAALGVPTTYLVTSFYWDNFIHFGMNPKPSADGALELAIPMAAAKLCGIAAEDIGKCALGIFERGKEYIGKRVGIAGGCLTGAEMAASLGRALGKPVRYVAVPFDVYRGLGFPAAVELGNMFQIDAEFQDRFMAARDLREARALNPALQSFDAWAERHKTEIPTG